MVTWGCRGFAWAGARNIMLVAAVRVGSPGSQRYLATALERLKFPLPRKRSKNNCLHGAQLAAGIDWVASRWAWQAALPLRQRVCGRQPARSVGQTAFGLGDLQPALDPSLGKVIGSNFWMNRCRSYALIGRGSCEANRSGAAGCVWQSRRARASDASPARRGPSSRKPA